MTSTDPRILNLLISYPAGRGLGALFLESDDSPLEKSDSCLVDRHCRHYPHNHRSSRADFGDLGAIEQYQIFEDRFGDTPDESG